MNSKMRKVIVNSTPLIALAGIGCLDVLQKLYGKITIPRAVYTEINAKPDSECSKQLKLNVDWIQIDDISNVDAKAYYKTQLHDGEVEVMILAKERSADLVIIDDNNAKKHAQYLGLPVTGTLGVLMKAKSVGYISELKPLLQKMVDNHIYISQVLIDKCLKRVGE